MFLLLLLQLRIDHTVIVDDDSSMDVPTMSSQIMTASQIDTSVGLSANTLADMFESSKEDSDDGGHVVGAFQLLLSGAESNVESDYSAEDTGPFDADDVVGIPTVNDVNVLATGDNSDDYESISSSGIDDIDSVNDDSVEPREYPVKDDFSGAEVEHLDDGFIQSIMEV